MRIRFAGSARRHRVARSRVLYVIEHCGLRFEVAPPAGAPDGQTVRLVYLGDDAAGIALEVMAVEHETGDLLVIHAMLLRPKYRSEYEEARKWQN